MPSVSHTCVAREIDVTPDHFTPEMLRKWKAAQLAEYQGLQKGWLLSPDKVAEVRRASLRKDVPMNVVTDRCG